MVILHVVAPAEVGGLERVVQMLAPGLARAGNDVHVAAVLDAPGGSHPLLRGLGDGVRTHPIILPSRAYRRERAVMKDLCRRLRPDVVHTHGYHPDVVDASVARRLGIPIVSTVHGFTGGGWKNRLYERFQRRAHRRFDAVVAVSNALKVQLIRDGIPADRIHVVQNAWEETAPAFDRSTARQALGVSVDGFRAGWVGRLSAEKGPDVLLDALAGLSDLPLSVSLVGDGPEQRALRTRARRPGVQGRVQWHGVVPDMARYFAAFDLFVLSSRTEGTPIVLFEAMAAGVPIVAAGVGGVPDVVSPAEAVVVPPEDPVALAAAIRSVFADPAMARARAQRARERLVANFAVRPCVQRYDAIYRLVSQSTAGRRESRSSAPVTL